MRKAVKLRTLKTEEIEVRRFARLQKEPRYLVQRAKLIVALLDNLKLYAIHAAIAVDSCREQTGNNWGDGSTRKDWPGYRTNPKLGVCPPMRQRSEPNPTAWGHPLKRDR